MKFVDTPLRRHFTAHSFTVLCQYAVCKIVFNDNDRTPSVIEGQYIIDYSLSLVDACKRDIDRVSKNVPTYVCSVFVKCEQILIY